MGNPDSVKLLEQLKTETGLDRSGVFRLALRALAKERLGEKRKR